MVKYSNISKERVEESYKLFIENVSEEECKIKDWIGRSSQGPAKLLIR